MTPRIEQFYMARLDAYARLHGIAECIVRDLGQANDDDLKKTLAQALARLERELEDTMEEMRA